MWDFSECVIVIVIVTPPSCSHFHSLPLFAHTHDPPPHGSPAEDVAMLTTRDVADNFGQYFANIADTAEALRQIWRVVGAERFIQLT